MRKISICLLLSAFAHLIGFTQSTTITPGGTTESININGVKNGMVFSGLTTQERDAIANPKAGQLIYNKTKGCFEFYNGLKWYNLCENDLNNNNQAPSAGFRYSKNGLQVLFTNTSQRASSYLWDFGNGHTDTTFSNPSITYANPGIYTVTLKAFNSNGNSISSQTITLSLSPEIGSDYQGGVVAYILKQGDAGYDPNQIHGIIASKLDQTINSYSPYYPGTGIMWQQGTYIPSQQTTVFDITGAAGTAVGMGRSNTNLIIAKQTSTGRPFAATAIAVAYRGGGYTDWFLPSKDELHKLYLNRSIIGGFFDGWYWSSTEKDEWYVEALDFSNGVSSGGYKGPGGTPYKVRAIRTF